MKNGTQPSPAESAAICGTEWLVFSEPTTLAAESSLAAAWPLSASPCEEPAALSAPPEDPAFAPLDSSLPPAAAVSAAVSPLDEDSPATGIVASAPLPELDPLVLSSPPPPPTPGSAEPYWSVAGAPASATGAATSAAAASDTTAKASANHGM
jgi:hypothetical protein